MNELILSIIQDNIELHRADIGGESLEVLALAIQLLLESLAFSGDLGEQRGILYDIATAAIMAIEDSYSEEE